VADRRTAYCSTAVRAFIAVTKEVTAAFEEAGGVLTRMP
jgi:hypothetical protein